MNPATAARLLQINREFYDQFGRSFSATRRRIQPGVRRVLETLRGDESILDLGCGNGELARTLAKRGHRGPYLGLDFSLPLLREAESHFEGFSAAFRAVDLTHLSLTEDRPLSTDHWPLVTDHRPLVTGHWSLVPDHWPLVTENWSLVTAFAVLHHIPSAELRLEILKKVRMLLKPGGRFIHSNWQFLNSEKLKARIQPWEAASVSASEVEAGDYLLDWRSGGKGLRYVHHFREEELSGLAAASGFHIVETFYSDGGSGNLSLYQVWK